MPESSAPYGSPDQPTAPMTLEQALNLPNPPRIVAAARDMFDLCEKFGLTTNEAALAVQQLQMFIGAQRVQRPRPEPSGPTPKGK